MQASLCADSKTEILQILHFCLPECFQMMTKNVSELCFLPYTWECSPVRWTKKIFLPWWQSKLCTRSELHTAHLHWWGDKCFKTDIFPLLGQSLKNFHVCTSFHERNLELIARIVNQVKSSFHWGWVRCRNQTGIQSRSRTLFLLQTRISSTRIMFLLSCQTHFFFPCPAISDTDDTFQEYVNYFCPWPRCEVSEMNYFKSFGAGIKCLFFSCLLGNLTWLIFRPVFFSYEKQGMIFRIFSDREALLW